MTKISEAANLLGISKQAISKRIRQPKYQPHVVKKGNVLYITDVGMSMLQGLDNPSTSKPKSDNLDVGDSNNPRVVELLQDAVKSKDVEINRLVGEVEYLRRMNEAQLQALNNQQILTLNAQAEVKRLSQPQEQEPIVAQQEEQKGFWQRIFSKV